MSDLAPWNVRDGTRHTSDARAARRRRAVTLLITNALC
jgi:hypothetical protein